MQGRTEQTGVISATIKGVRLAFRTHPALFSPRYIDPGTLAMLSCVELGADEKVLDLGCGYGIVGILIAKLIGPDKVTMADLDPLAVEYARINAKLNNVESVRIIQSDGYDSIDDSGFTAILVNPPYHTDFSVPKRLIEKGFNRLAMGGRMTLVVKRRKWYENKLRAVLGGVRIQEVDGYYVMTSERRSEHWATATRRSASRSGRSAPGSEARQVKP